MEEIDIAIVGGGPSGLQAAISLATQGYSPVVFEEDQVIGKPIQCGEGISLNALKEFDLMKSRNSFCVREYEYCVLYLPSNDTILGDIHSFTINRDSFDQHLAKTALSAGAELKLSTKVEHISRREDRLFLQTSGEEKQDFKCDMLILAEGPRAHLASKLGFSPPTPLIGAFEYKVKGEWGQTLEFYFNKDKYPSGYCWIFPKEDETNIGIVTTAK